MAHGCPRSGSPEGKALTFMEASAFQVIICLLTTYWHAGIDLRSRLLEKYLNTYNNIIINNIDYDSVLWLYELNIYVTPPAIQSTIHGLANSQSNAVT